ncbi:transcriptional regulator [Companilactobacillus sp. RD055328]|uniref:LysR family transcriptional regulator n=1 Tax=Companilactobacillus sp. RD055328 TaxID=2916634 RepID=UPI001FC86CA3|nr:LysR family transcriptional regulator [Companilactobacillus sp. RD055328]GKQ43031.1 transcriptional regulator [Companilactobacillus sp. RD055328]
MDIDLLKIFIRVAEAKSINQVSESLSLTQPAISKKIKQLEEEFNTQLFIRSSQGMTLTNGGTQLYEQALPFLKQFEYMKSSVNNSSISFNNIKIGVLDSISSYKYSQFFIDNMANFQEIIISNKIFDLINPFNSGQLDTLIIDSSFKNNFKGDYFERKLFVEPYYVVYSKNNNAINLLNSNITPQKLQPLKLIMYPKYCPIHQRIVQTYKSIDLVPPQIMEIDYSESTISTVTNSDYVTILPEAMARNKVSQDPQHLAMKQLDITFIRNVSLFSRNKKVLDFLDKLN